MVIKKKSSFLPLQLLFVLFQDFGALTQVQGVFCLEKNKVSVSFLHRNIK